SHACHTPANEHVGYPPPRPLRVVGVLRALCHHLAALALARQHEAKALELRARLSLTRLWQQHTSRRDGNNTVFFRLDSALYLVGIVSHSRIYESALYGSYPLTLQFHDMSLLVSEMSHCPTSNDSEYTSNFITKLC